MKRRLQLTGLAAIAIAACVDGGRSSGPNFAISDATHGTGDRNAFFYWLPPLVPQPAFSGVFNRFASPTVTVCQLNGARTACALGSGGAPIVVAQFTTSTGTGSEVIRVSNGQYVVNWHTDLSDLDPAQVYRISVKVDGRDYGFADVEVGATARELKNVNQNEFVPLVDGRTLPIKFRIEAGAACSGREAECAEAIVNPTVQQRVILDDADVPLAFGEFPPGWTNEPQLVRIERIPDAAFGVGEGPLATEFPQYPLFFHYFTTAPEPFNLKVRIGVCNVEDPSDNDFHPHHRETTVLAMGGTPETFRTLTRVDVTDVLGKTCLGAKRQEPEIGWLPARLNEFAAALFPKILHASAVVDGGMGGSTDLFSPAGTVDTGTIASEFWSPTGGLATGRQFHAAVGLPNGVIVMGGVNGGFTTLASVELYDTIPNTFQTVASMVSAREQFAAVQLPNAVVLAIGGLIRGASTTVLASAEKYQVGSSSWQAVGSLSTARWGHTATALQDGRVLVTGGTGSSGQILSSAEVYDPETNAFTTVGNMAFARQGHTATLLSNGQVLIAGGFNGNSVGPAELFDPLTNTFSTTGTLNVSRHAHTATALTNGTVLLTGGVHIAAGDATARSATAEIYSPATGTFALTGSMASARIQHGAARLWDGRVLVAGGEDANGNSLASAELYDPAAGTFSSAGSMANARARHTTTMLPTFNPRIIVVGGEGVGVLQSAEIFRPAVVIP